MEGRPGELEVEWLGCVPYADALALQERAVAARRDRGAGDRLLLLEHPPVVTLGRSAKPENLLATREALAARGIETFEIRRGGDVTYHAPGQLVGYLVLDLQERARRDGCEPDVHRFLRRIEAALIEATADIGVACERVSGLTGVFASPVQPETPETPGAPSAPEPAPLRKIASIGVGLRGWVSYHGFALNVTLDLAGFETIVPCGLRGVAMTSIRRELGRELGREPGRGGDPAGAACLDTSMRRAVSGAFRRHFSG